MLMTGEKELARGESLAFKTVVVLYHGAAGWYPAGSRQILRPERWGVAYGTRSERYGRYWLNESDARTHFAKMTGAA